MYEQLIVGQQGKFKIVERGLPVKQGTIVNGSMVRYGNVRVRLEDGTVVLALFPAVD